MYLSQVGILWKICPTAIRLTPALYYCETQIPNYIRKILMAQKVLHVAKSVIDKYLILNRASRIPV
jgi:hypothetical protein